MLKLLPKSASLSQLERALSEVSSKPFGSLFVARLARSLGLKKTRVRDLGKNMSFILEEAKRDIGRVVLYYNIRAMRRNTLNSMKDEVIKLIIEYVLARYKDMVAEGMSEQQAVATLIDELSEIKKA
jgi:hypothetical protein